MQRDFGKSCKQVHLYQILPPHLVPVIILVHRSKFIGSYCYLNSRFLYLTYLSGECSSTMNNLQSSTIHGFDNYTSIVKGNYWQLGLTNSTVHKMEFPLSYAPSRKCLLILLFTTTVLSNCDYHENIKS